MPIMGWPSPPTDSYGFVAEEKRQQIREVERQYVQQKADLERLHSPSAWVAPDNTALMELERQHQADLARILSPQEMTEYLYRVSPAAKYVRENLPAAWDISKGDGATADGVRSRRAFPRRDPHSLVVG